MGGERTKVRPYKDCLQPLSLILDMSQFLFALRPCVSAL
jgi:hypothetical protein